MGRVLTSPASIGREALPIVAAALIVASCSNSAPPSSTSTTVESADTTQVDIVDAADSSLPPATRAEPNQAGPVQDWQIGWVRMDERAVEVEWQPAGPNVNYELFRVGSVGVDPSTVRLEDANVIYSGLATSFVDETVDPDTFYTYIVTAESDRSDRRWTDTLTTTDVTAPSPILGLEAEETSEGLKLSWLPSSDDVEFASYAVSIVGKDDELTYIGGGADERVTTFVDNGWSGATTTYAVQAVDFHNNRTVPAKITVG